ncbi:hypothetical protein ALC62_09623, partial [Cyphomyrmex costatus]
DENCFENERLFRFAARFAGQENRGFCTLAEGEGRRLRVRAIVIDDVRLASCLPACLPIPPLFVLLIDLHPRADKFVMSCVECSSDRYTLNTNDRQRLSSSTTSTNERFHVCLTVQLMNNEEAVIAVIII